MQTNLVERYANTDYGREAEGHSQEMCPLRILATCPTYQLLGDELDGPRGRIYQIKEILEGSTPTASTQGHLDRCLTCRSARQHASGLIMVVSPISVAKLLRTKLAGPDRDIDSKSIDFRHSKSTAVWNLDAPWPIISSADAERDPSQDPAAPRQAVGHSRRILENAGTRSLCTTLGHSKCQCSRCSRARSFGYSVDRCKRGRLLRCCSSSQVTITGV